MPWLAAIPLTCWLCALLAVPRRPPPGDEDAELVYRRLVGRQHLLVAFAVSVTLAACFGAFLAVFAPAAP